MMTTTAPRNAAGIRTEIGHKGVPFLSAGRAARGARLCWRGALRRPGRRGVAETHEASLAGVRQVATRKSRFGAEANLWQGLHRRGALVELLTGLGVAVVSVGCGRFNRASAGNTEENLRALVAPLGPMYTREEESERDKQQVQALARDAHTCI